MADNFLNKTGLQYFYNRIKTVFADKGEFETVKGQVEDLIETGGEPNVIETVKVNGTALVPDAQKAVDVTVPTDQDITDLADVAIAASISGSDTGSIASKGYVATNGGKIDVIKVNGTAQTIVNKEVNIAVPTKTSDITNDSTYQTLAEVTQAIDDAIAEVTQFDYEIVSTLPASGTKGTIYLVEDSQNPGSYEEYIWIETSWEKIGNTGTIDLSGYWAKTELTAITTAEIDVIIG